MDFLSSTMDFLSSSMDYLSSKSPSGLQIAVHTVAALALGSAFYVYNVWQMWVNEFAGQRLLRTNESSKSRKQAPAPTRFTTFKNDILDSLGEDELVEDVQLKKRKSNKKENMVLRQRAARLSFGGSKLDQKSEAAAGLDMDHVFVAFRDFLWGLVFIGPMSYILWKRGTVWLSVRKFLNNAGLLTVEKCDYEALVGTLCLEQSQVIHYFTRTKSKDGKNIAGFFFTDFPYVTNDLEFKVAELFVVEVDLDTKRYVSAKIDGVETNASQTVILLFFNTIAAQHVKLHAMANWGINNSNNMKEINPFFYQNSVVTIMYNYFGYTSFSGFLKTWEKQGLLSDGWSDKGPLLKSFNHGINAGVIQHPHITELVNYSRFVNFSVKVRSIFIQQFAKHKHLFPGVDGEAFFVGTILHSLDHTLMEWNVVDPLWLDTEDPKYGKMAELGRVVRVGFVEDVPFLYFNKRFKGSKHPFYKAVYEKAAKIDQGLADYMDTCIIK